MSQLLPTVNVADLPSSVIGTLHNNTREYYVPIIPNCHSGKGLNALVPPPYGNTRLRNAPVILVTGGAGFIGSNFVLDWLAHCDEPVVNLDLLTYAGNLENLKSLDNHPGHTFVQGDICDRALVDRLLADHLPRAVVHFAAESHVDRSIHGPGAFMQTNVHGTFNLLEATRGYFASLAVGLRAGFRFLHVSTDEVYGSLGPQDPPFTETHTYEPNSPYSASKAASDHLVRAWHHTYGLPVLTTNCSNNYGPFQFPEKLIPLMIVNALAGKPLPVYGDGMQVRDWLYVKDHCSAIREVLARGKIGETYNVGGWNEKANIEIVHTVCRLLDRTATRPDGKLQPAHHPRDGSSRSRSSLCDRCAQDRKRNWAGGPPKPSRAGSARRLQWYLDNPEWVANVQSGGVSGLGRQELRDSSCPLKILLFGKNGQVGWELQRSLAPIGELIALDRTDAAPACGDLSRPELVAEQCGRVQPDVIVNAAAYTAVDKAESEPDLARTINAVAPGALARGSRGVRSVAGPLQHGLRIRRVRHLHPGRKTIRPVP